MSSVHLDRGIEKLMFGKFTRKSMKQSIFNDAAKENKIVLESLKPEHCGLKSLKNGK